MKPTPIGTKSLTLVALTKEDARACAEAMPPDERAEVSPQWFALLERSASCDPWIHGFAMVHPASGAVVGRCGFKGPPTSEGAVEIAYGVAPEYQGRGYATEAAEALTAWALRQPGVRIVLAHTLPHPSASTRVLTKCEFHRTGEVIDSEDGLVWRWERRTAGSTGERGGEQLPSPLPGTLAEGDRGPQ